MTVKEEFKLVKKVLRKHGCLRAYRRTLRKKFGRSLFEDVCATHELNKGYEIPCIENWIRDEDLIVAIEEDFYNQQFRYS